MENVRARKRARQPETWKREIRKRRRNSGPEYIGRTQRANAASHFDPSVQCCKVTGRRPATECQYRDLPEDQRKAIFDDFWALASYNMQNAHLYGLVDRKPKMRARNRKKPGESKRAVTFAYNLRDNTSDRQRKRVCKTAFLRVFGISNDRLRTVRGEPKSDFNFTKRVTTSDKVT